MSESCNFILRNHAKEFVDLFGGGSSVIMMKFSYTPQVESPFNEVK